MREEGGLVDLRELPWSRRGFVGGALQDSSELQVRIGGGFVGEVRRGGEGREYLCGSEVRAATGGGRGAGGRRPDDGEVRV